MIKIHRLAMVYGGRFNIFFDSPDCPDWIDCDVLPDNSVRNIVRYPKKFNRGDIRHFAAMAGGHGFAIWKAVEISSLTYDNLMAIYPKWRSKGRG